MAPRQQQPLPTARHGNGQYVHIIDFDGVDVGLAEINAGWPYLKEATVTVALNYGARRPRDLLRAAPGTDPCPRLPPL